MDENGRASHRCETLRAGGVVRLDVGFEDVRDPHVLLGGGLELQLLQEQLEQVLRRLLTSPRRRHKDGCRCLEVEGG